MSGKTLPAVMISNTKSIKGVFTQNQWITKTQVEEKMKQIELNYDELKSVRL